MNMIKTMLIAIAFASAFTITSCGNKDQEVESTEVDTTEVVACFHVTRD
jgi:hypothetical protein